MNCTGDISSKYKEVLNNYPIKIKDGQFFYGKNGVSGGRTGWMLTKLFENIQDFSTPEGHGILKVWMSHGDSVTELPAGFKLMASTDSCPIAGMADEDRNFYAVQFHPEVTHTVLGKSILERFVHQICACGTDWVMGDYIAEAVALIRKQVGADEVILGLSGGVDSSVAAALSGLNSYFIFFETNRLGLFRKLAVARPVRP